MRFKRLAALGLAGVMLASVFTGCGINKSATAATLGEQQISLGVVNFLCRFQQATNDDMLTMYQQMYEGLEDPWNTDMQGNGITMMENLKASTVESLHTYYTLQNHMADYGITISDEQKAAIAEAAANFMNANSKEALKEMGATQEIVEEVLTLYTVYDLMEEAMIADVDTNVSDEEANMRGFAMIRLTPSDDEDIDAVNAKADEMLAAINESGAIGDVELADDDAETEDAESEDTESEDTESEDVESEDVESEDVETEDVEAEEVPEVADPDAPTVMEQVAEEYGYTVTNSTYAADDTKLEAEVKEALDGIKFTDPAVKVSTDSVVFILQITTETDVEATESNRESIIQARKDARFEEILTGWQTDDGWKVDEKAMAKIVFDDRFTLVDPNAIVETEEAEVTTEE